MPQRSKIESLPPDVHQALADDLRRYGHGKFVYLSEQLKAKGYDINKSAIGVFSQELRELDAQAAGRAQERRFERAKLRLAALKIAQEMHPRKTVEELYVLAEGYFKFMIEGADSIA